MIWVKASNRLPTKDGSYFCRNVLDGYKKVMWFSKNGKSGYLRTRSHSMQWLDENPASVDLSDKGETFFAR